jgi:hypothetical protein
MATVNKDFKIKSGLIVEGSSATVGGYDILTKASSSDAHIIALAGGGATSANEANKVVKRDGSGNFAAGTITAALTGNASTATTLATARTIAGQSFDGSANISIAPTDLTGVTATAAEINLLDGVTATTTELNYVDGVTSAIQTQIDTKAPIASPTFTGTVSGITKSMVGLANVDDTSDANKPISTAAQSALDLKAPLASPALTGTPTAPTATAGTSTTQVATTAFVGTAVANLVDSAPALLDTLNELAAAIGDNPNYATDLAASVGLKAPLASPTFTGTVTLPANTITQSMMSDDSVGTNELGGLAVTTGKIADAAVTSAKLATSLDFSGVPTAPTAAAGTNTTQVATTAFVKAAADAAAAVANALTTDDVAEGTAQYFTDARAKSSAAALLTGATLSNITITGTGAGLTITAEDGIAGKTTSDLSEGTNLYFTDARARTAVDGTSRSFTSVEINSVAKQVAATLEASTAGVQTAHAFAKADYRSAEYLVKIANGNHTDISKVLLTLDSSDNIAITEYGMVSTGSSLGSVSASISGANVQLLVTTANNTSVVTVVGTLLK